MSGEATAEALVDRVLKREPRAVARAMRAVDDRASGFSALLKALYPHTGGAYVIGVTGTPGAGKSTLVDRMIGAYRARDLSVGVVAVDPTSPFSGGAILGDRIRMQRHFLDADVFIRSLATRGHLGGLSRSAGDVIHVLDAAGFDIVIVETVGVGQDELDVTQLAHTTVVVMAPGMGDDIQAIKAGILEVAEVFAVNKADRDGADSTVRDLQQMIALGRQPRALPARHGHSAAAAATTHGGGGDEWTPPIVKTIASKGEGVDELVEAVGAHREWVVDPERGADKRMRRLSHELLTVFRETLARESERRLSSQIAESLVAIAAREDDPYSATDRLIGSLLVPEEVRP
jgi:LAO/AO transport system kinase